MPLAMLALTPRIRPFRWSRLIFTYVLPAIPLLGLVDGIVSMLRIYSPRELREMVAGVAGHETFDWDIGTQPVRGSPDRAHLPRRGAANRARASRPARTADIRCLPLTASASMTSSRCPRPSALIRSLPIEGTPVERLVGETRQRVRQILHGRSDRLLVVIGPCSIHDPRGRARLRSSASPTSVDGTLRTSRS